MGALEGLEPNIYLTTVRLVTGRSTRRSLAPAETALTRASGVDGFQVRRGSSAGVLRGPFEIKSQRSASVEVQRRPVGATGLAVSSAVTQRGLAFGVFRISLGWESSPCGPMEH